jgi:CheY-like chemotaxis protein
MTLAVNPIIYRSSMVDNRTERTMNTVLIIDDDPTICRSLGRLLRFLNFRVISARSGAEAVTLVEGMANDEKIDLAICDVQMPDMSGHEVAAAFAERFPVILMSGALNQQLNGVLAKPFTPTELIEHIESALQVAA